MVPVEEEISDPNKTSSLNSSNKLFMHSARDAMSKYLTTTEVSQHRLVANNISSRRKWFTAV